MEIPIKPTNKHRRISWIDAARGFAIFGIFIVNIGSFGTPYFLYGGAEEVWTSPVDQATMAAIDIFFQASFYTTFSLLFGFSLQMMKENFIAKNRNIFPIFLRRLVILILFGLLHAFFIWHGDILLSYGVIGLLLLLFMQLSARRILIIGTAVLGASSLFITSIYYAGRDYLGFVQWPLIEQAMKHYQSGRIPIIWMQNYHDWMYANGSISFLILITILLPLFLFGMYLAKKRWIHEPYMYKRTVIVLWSVSLCLFLTLKIGPYFFRNPLWFSFIQDNIGGTFSALFYLSTFTIIAQSKVGEKLIKPFTYVGRMALTNYILQSVVCFFIFYLLGLYGTVRPIALVGMVFVIYIFQIILSKWWLTRFRFGPLEWVWRSLTYMKMQPFREEK